MNRTDYVSAVKKGLGIKVSNHGFWYAWTAAESGTEHCNGISGARFNCLNTTWRMPGSTDFNSVGVQNYRTFAEGITAEVNTLKLHYYAELIKACRSGADLGHLAELLVHSPYGTGNAIWAGIKAYHENPKLYRGLPVG